MGVEKILHPEDFVIVSRFGEIGEIGGEDAQLRTHGFQVLREIHGLIPGIRQGT